MEEELLNLIGKFLVEAIREQIKTPEARFDKRYGEKKRPPRYNFYASGSLYNSVSYIIRDGEIDILMNDYGVDFVFGEGSWPGGGQYYPDTRKKGTKAKTSPLITALEKWAKDKLHLPEAKAKSMAFATRKSLFRAGYKGYRLFNDKFQEKINNYISQLLEQPQYQEAVLGDIFDRINIFGNQQYQIAIS
jgi:hypothetical protein